MKNVFKLWFIALAVIIVCPAFAQSEGDYNVDLTKDDSGVVIKRYTGTQRAVTIPTKIQGYPVKEIADNAFSREGTNTTSLTSIVIPVGVVSIGNSAFSSQSSLTSVTIPVGVTFIGNSAFAGCSSLATVTIPASVTSIGDYVFSGCSKLATVNFSEGLVEIGKGAFISCSTLKTIKLPNSLKILGVSAFSDSGLITVTLGTGLTEIPESIFSYVTYGTGPRRFPDPENPWDSDRNRDDPYYNGLSSGLPIKTIVIPEGVTYISRNAFRNCKELTAVTLPSTLQGIGANAFNGCSALTTVTIPATLTSVRFEINTYQRWYAGLHRYEEGVFDGCYKLLLATRAALQRLGWDGKLEREPVFIPTDK